MDLTRRGGAVKRLVKKPANPLHLESRTDPGIDVRVSTTRAKQRGIVQSPGQERQGLASDLPGPSPERLRSALTRHAGHASVVGRVSEFYSSGNKSHGLDV